MFIKGLINCLFIFSLLFSDVHLLCYHNLEVTGYLITLVKCDIESNIVSTASSFSFNLSENPVLNCALFLNESMVIWTKDQVLTGAVWHFIKNKVYHLVPA